MVWGLCLAGTMFPRFLHVAQLLLWWVIGGEVDFQECMWCLVLHLSGRGHYCFCCQVPAPEASCQGFGWRSKDSTPSLKALCLGMESGGTWEEAEKKGECRMDPMGKWGGREVRALLFRCFLSFLLTLLLSSAHSFFSPNSCFWSHLESALDLLLYCYNQTNVSQVFPIVRLRITWWVREETGRGQL